MSSKKPHIVLIGGGGHCISVIDVIEQEGKYDILGVLDRDKETNSVLGYPVLGDDDLISELSKRDNVSFVITVGQIKSYAIREKIAATLHKLNAQLATIISPKAYVSQHAKIRTGTVIMHQAVVNAAACVGNHCIINTMANIEHGAIIEDFCHISTGAMVNGDTVVKKGSFIGSNAVLSHSIVVPENSIISAGKFIK